jgi:hypothetical protein
VRYLLCSLARTHDKQVYCVSLWDSSVSRQAKCRLKHSSFLNRRRVDRDLDSKRILLQGHGILVSFEAFTVVTMKNAVFWDLMPCGSCKNLHFGGMYRLHHQGDKNRRAMNSVLLRSVLQLLVSANVLLNS